MRVNGEYEGARIAWRVTYKTLLLEEKPQFNCQLLNVINFVINCDIFHIGNTRKIFNYQLTYGIAIISLRVN